MKKIIMLCLMLGMAACGGPVKRVFPPQVSLQEVVLQADGKLAVKFRIQNYSTVPTRYSQITGKIKFADIDAASLNFNPDISVGPGSNEIVQQSFPLDTAAASAINAAIKNRTRLSYKINGEITSSEPRGRYEIKYESALNAVPGLSGTLR
jgi:LEA14-like dessication related protein